jgi:hypothetical protein
MTVVSAAVCPMTPLLFRHLSGAADPVAELRSTAVRAVRDATRDAARVVVLAPVGGREAPAAWTDPATGHGHGSLADQVGAHLLSLAGCRMPSTCVEVPGGGAITALAALVEPVALLVLGDGAAARGEGAPAYLDERSFGYDDRVAALLEAGDGAGLAGLDAGLGAELMVTGRWSWPVLGELVPSADAELRWRGDPFGVSYFVALWRPHPM